MLVQQKMGCRRGNIRSENATVGGIKLLRSPNTPKSTIAEHPPTMRNLTNLTLAIRLNIPLQMPSNPLPASNLSL